MPSQPLPKINFDEERERFQAEGKSVEIKTAKCEHDIKRISGMEVVCKKCHIGWLDNGKVFPLL